MAIQHEVIDETIGRNDNIQWFESCRCRVTVTHIPGAENATAYCRSRGDETYSTMFEIQAKPIFLVLSLSLSTFTVGLSRVRQMDRGDRSLAYRFRSGAMAAARGGVASCLELGRHAAPTRIDSSRAKHYLR